MQVRQRIRTPIWPYVAVVACLFILSILASRSWRGRSTLVERPRAFEHAQVAHQHDRHAHEAHEHESHAHDVDSPPAAPQDAPEQLAHDHPGSVRTGLEQTAHQTEPESPGRSAAELNAPEMTATVVAGSSTHEDLSEPAEKPAPQEILARDIEPQIAATKPIVAQQVPRDISVTETPALPIDSTVARPMPTESVESESADTMQHNTPAVIDKGDQAATDIVSHVFPHPESLVQGYESLLGDRNSAEWAQQGLDFFERLAGVSSIESPDAKEILLQLESHADAAAKIAEKAASLQRRAEILRVGYATKRRVEIWIQIQKIVSSGSTSPAPTNSTAMVSHLMAVEQRLRSEDHAGAWRDYLMLTEMRKHASSKNAAVDHDLARRVLKRMDSTQLTETQSQIFTRPPFDLFRTELCRWAAEPIDYPQMMVDLEAFEQNGTVGNAVSVTRYYETLRWSSDANVKKLADLLNAHYRNSNVRVAMTADFLNRLLPDSQQIEEDVEDNISGAQVYGTSRTKNQLQVVLVPDANNLRIGLEARGEVESDTAASKGPATFYNQGFARYHVRKLLLIDRRGMRVWRAEGEADSETELTGFETDYDALPLIGWLARSMARQQHDDRYFETKAETEAKLEQHATARFDEHVHNGLAKAEEQVNRKFIQPFAKINLKPTPVDLHTTEKRVIARYRLATDSQLGAHTPRPQAPGDSLMSVQVHESALNNTLANLHLEGRRTNLRALYREIADTFSRPDVKVPEDVSDEVILQFAEEDAIRVRCDDGRVTVTIRIKELKSGRAKWTDFAVKAFYVPDSQQLTANLVRDGGIELVGERLGERLPLRVIFNKVLAKDRPFNVINNKLSQKQKLQDLHVNQFVINDGWIGVAIGPTRAGDLDHFAREKSSGQAR